MDEHRAGEGGAANTPPFPRLDTVAAESTQAGVPDVPDADRDEPDTDESTRSSSLDEESPIYDGSPAAGPATAGNADDSGPFEYDEVRPPRFADRAREEMRRRASGSVQRGFERFADRLDEAAQRIERIADEQLHGSGVRQRAGSAAQSTASWLGDFSEYIREADLDAIRVDVEEQVREYPLRSILIAAGAGWLLGKIMR